MLKDVCESTESLYIVQELCDGGSLMDFMMKVVVAGGGGVRRRRVMVAMLARACLSVPTPPFMTPELADGPPSPRARRLPACPPQEAPLKEERAAAIFHGVIRSVMHCHEVRGAGVAGGREVRGGGPPSGHALSRGEGGGGGPPYAYFLRRPAAALP